MFDHPLPISWKQFFLDSMNESDMIKKDEFNHTITIPWEKDSKHEPNTAKFRSFEEEKNMLMMIIEELK